MTLLLSPVFSPLAVEICDCTPVYVTGNRTSSITVTTNLTLAAGVPSNFVDGAEGLNASDSVTLPISHTLTSSDEIKFDFGPGNKILITEARWKQGGAASANTQGTWRWQGSNDDSSWTNIGNSFLLGGGATQLHTELGGNTIGYRYYRLNGVSGSTGSNPPWSTEIEFEQCTC